MGALAGRRSNVEARSWIPEPPIPPYLRAPMPGSGVNVANQPERAMIVPAVWGCVQLIAGAISMLTLETYRRTTDVPERITDPALITSPSDNMTQSEWLHMLVVSLLLRGNGLGLKNQPLESTIRPTQVNLLHPDKVHLEVDDSGGVRYLLGPRRVDVTSRIWHVRGMTLPGSKVGLSPIAAAAMAIGVDLASRKFAQDFFEGGGIPKSTLTTDQEIDEDQARIAKDRLMMATQHREPAVFGNGVKYNQISVAPNESQFLETQQSNISEIARFFGIPAEMIGGKTGSSMTYANVEQRSLDFLTYAVAPWLKRIEDAVSALLPQPQFVKFNTKELLRTDAETQAKVAAQMVAAKIKPPSRILTELGEAPLTDDEKAELELVPLTVTATGQPRVNPTASISGASDTPAIEPAPPKLGVVRNG